MIPDDGANDYGRMLKNLGVLRIYFCDLIETNQMSSNIYAQFLSFYDAEEVASMLNNQKYVYVGKMIKLKVQVDESPRPVWACKYDIPEQLKMFGFGGSGDQWKVMP
uniref:RRM domain-containing protein n=1 Tax=Romanomermis culicivorax TaxID=13658 RepID=A0A915HUG6_ROMCU